MTETKEYSTEAIAQVMSLKKASPLVSDITEQLAQCKTNQALVHAAQGARESYTPLIFMQNAFNIMNCKITLITSMLLFI